MLMDVHERCRSRGLRPTPQPANRLDCAPDANVGYSLLIRRLSAADLQAALLGPAPEIDDEPL